jgi:hypothetical protein
MKGEAMVSVVLVLIAILAIGFVGVSLVGFMTWRQRMRRDGDVGLDYSKAG